MSNNGVNPIVIAVTALVFMLIGAFIVPKLTEIAPPPKETLKVTFDSVNLPTGQLLRMTDCYTNIVCYGGGGVLSCVSPTEADHKFWALMKERCK